MTYCSFFELSGRVHGPDRGKGTLTWQVRFVFDPIRVVRKELDPSRSVLLFNGPLKAAKSKSLVILQLVSVNARPFPYRLFEQRADRLVERTAVE